MSKINTNPELSISTNETIGRLYQLPNTGYASTITPKEAREGLRSGALMPSITNCIDALNPKLEGYVSFMFSKALKAGLTTKEAGQAHITYRDATAERGTRVHKAIEDFINAGLAKPERFEALMETEYYKALDSYRELVKYNNTMNLLGKSNDIIYFNAFLKFVRDYKPRFISQEATVFGDLS